MSGEQCAYWSTQKIKDFGCTILQTKLFGVIQVKDSIVALNQHKQRSELQNMKLLILHSPTWCHLVMINKKYQFTHRWQYCAQMSQIIFGCSKPVPLKITSFPGMSMDFTMRQCFTTHGRDMAEEVGVQGLDWTDVPSRK